VIYNKSRLQFSIGRWISKVNAYLPAFAKQLPAPKIGIVPMCGLALCSEYVRIYIAGPIVIWARVSA
jgi:hypothetical protein